MHENHRSRVRERYFADGLEKMDDCAVLEMLLFYCIPRKDTNPMAHLLIEQFGSLSGVLEASPEELRKIKGIGENAVAFLTLLPKVCKRYITGTLSEKSIYIDEYDEVCDFVRCFFAGADDEMFLMLTFDAGGRMTNSLESVGEKDSVMTDIQKLTEFAVNNKAAGVIIAHNHPDGVASPSRSDIDSTEIISSELKKQGIVLEDHIISGIDGLLSMRSTKNFSRVFGNG